MEDPSQIVSLSEEEKSSLSSLQYDEREREKFIILLGESGACASWKRESPILGFFLSLAKKCGKRERAAKLACSRITLHQRSTGFHNIWQHFPTSFLPMSFQD